MSLSVENKRTLINSALGKKLSTGSDQIKSFWVDDLTDTDAIYNQNGQSYSVPYTIDDKNAVALGEPVKVVRQVVYSVSEAVQRTHADLMVLAGTRGKVAVVGTVKEMQGLVSGLKAVEDEAAALKKLTEAATLIKAMEAVKTEDGDEYPASAFAYVPDTEKPSAWKLRLWEDTGKKVTKAQLGRAAAALSPGGFRGNKAEIPADALPAVKRKIRNEYGKLDVAAEDMPKWVKESAEVRDYIHESIEIPVAEVTAANIAKGILPIRIIKPGFNATKERHYGDNAVRDTVKVFEGAKQYANHASKSEEKDRPERDIRDWVATLENVHVSAKDGGAYGNARIHAGWFKDMVQGLYEAGTLNKLGVSINTVGKGSRQKIDGVDTFAVESLIDYPFKSVDYVTEAGAGGQAGVKESVGANTVDAYLIDLAKLKEVRPDLIKEVESEYLVKNKLEGNKKVELEEQVKTQETKINDLTKENGELKGQITEAAKAKAKADAQAQIKEAVAKAMLPEAAKARILDQFKEAVTGDGVDAAVKAETDYIAKLTESGKVKNLGATTSTPDKTKAGLKESYKRMGASDAEAEIAANGR